MTLFSGVLELPALCALVAPVGAFSGAESPWSMWPGAPGSLGNQPENGTGWWRAGLRRITAVAGRAINVAGSQDA